MDYELDRVAVILGEPKVAWIAGKSYPWGTVRYRGEEADRYTIEGSRAGHPLIMDHRVRGVLLQCENKWSLSIIWGSLTYSSNHNHPFGVWHLGEYEPDFIEAATTVEIGVFDPEGSFGDTPLCYVPVGEVVELLVKVSELPSNATHETVHIDYDQDVEKVVVVPREGNVLESPASSLLSVFSSGVHLATHRGFRPIIHD